MRSCRELRLRIRNGLQVAALHYEAIGRQPAPRILCLHGWLDNANSFVPLAEHLPNTELVAIDLPGHGLSEHRIGGYSPTDMMLCALDVLDVLGWKHCHVAGHSLGGCIAPLLAAAEPARVQSLILIDAIGPLSEPPERYTARLQRVLGDHRQPERYRSRHFATEAAAIDARLKAARMTRAAAQLIVSRQLEADGKGFRWRFDPALRVASAHYVTEAHVLGMLRALQCRVWCLLADDGFLMPRAETAERLAQLRRGQQLTLHGHHHIHMESPLQTAQAISEFLEAG